jgi:hypothetical protein
MNPFSSRKLFISASTLTIPYYDVGERIKKSSFSLTSSYGDLQVKLQDDGDGNLIDTDINTATFASSSKNFFYMSFNDAFKEIKDYISYEVSNTMVPQNIAEVASFYNSSNSGITYELNGKKKDAIVNGKLQLTPGIFDSSSVEPYHGRYRPSGMAIKWESTAGSHIHLPHDDVFDRFGKCDDWTISFWYQTHNASGDAVLLSKLGPIDELYRNQESQNVKTRRNFRNDFDDPMVLDDKTRVPFYISETHTATHRSIRFVACDGSSKLLLSSSYQPTEQYAWSHVAIRNSASLCNLFYNGVKVTGGDFDSGSIPGGVTANKNNVILGNYNDSTSITSDISLAEIRMYDYAASDAAISSLANINFLSASAYQTNVVGNVFYRNGQAVVSSVLPKHNSGSGIFAANKHQDITGQTWEARWRGTHTIYENQVMVRVPKDVLNVSINPTATFTPATDGGDICSTNQSNTLPGEQRKDLFISGTLKPYITTIGLYNDKSQLIALGKLAQPIQKRDDIDMNFVIRWDY